MHKIKQRIMIIDDDTLSCSAYRDILEMEGYDVDLQPDARKALQRLRECVTPDLILLDFRMPTMTGEEFVSALSNSNPDVYEKSQIVGFSSLKGTSFTRELESQLDGFVDKPSDLGEFVTMVRELTAKSA